MVRFTLSEILHATRGQMKQGEPSLVVRGVSTNSRTVKRGELFIAIRGDRFDGHDFIPDVVKRGAAAVIVSRGDIPVLESVAVIQVADTVKALGWIARAHRDRFDIPVIGITGSAGKTTTKEMLAQVLKVKYGVLFNHGTENNHIGVPQTLLKLRRSDDVVIVEMGTNHFGDIPWLVEVARPTIAILTNIGASHLAFLKTPKDVFLEKSALVKGLARGGLVIVNRDDRYLREISRRDRRHNVVTYGIDGPAAFRATDIQWDRKGRLLFRVNKRQPFILPSPVRTNIYNALVAISCGRAFKLSYNTIQKRLSRTRGYKGRQQIQRHGGLTVIDDTYNANPLSFASALETLSRLPTSGRRILVCGDMLELGQEGPALHRQVGEAAARSGVAAVFSLGPLARELAQSAQKQRPDIFTFSTEDMDLLQKNLLPYCRPGDVALVKGSRGMKMERAVLALSKSF